MCSRYLKDLDIRRSKIIHVYRNGDPYSRAIFVILRLPEQMALERIVKAIEEKVRLPLNRPIRKLFELTGTLVQSHTQIVDGNYYVAGSSENFLDIKYGHPANWVLVGPVKTNKYENVHYVTRAEEEGKPNQLSASNNVLSTSKTNKPTISSKKSGRKSIQSLKKDDKKKLKNKKMFASEHVDSILDDGINTTISLKIDQAKEDERKDEFKESGPQTESKALPEKSEIEELEMSKADDEIPISIEATPEIQVTENLSEDQNLTNFDTSSHVSVITDADQNREALGDDHEKSNNYFNQEDLEKINQDEGITTENETEQNVNELLLKDPIEDNQNKQDSNLDEIYSDDATKNQAATKIQAAFRGSLVRNELSKARKSDFPDDSIDENPDQSESTNDAEENI